MPGRLRRNPPVTIEIANRLNMSRRQYRRIPFWSARDLLVERLCVVLLVALVLVPCLGRAAEASRITVKQGRKFSLTLQSNPTTGYHWQLARTVNGTCLGLVTNRFVRPKSNLAGAPGKEIWEFKALSPGEATIELEYARPWEKGIPPAQKTNLVVTVVGTAKPAK